MDNMILCGDALVELKKLPTHSVDSIVADPPAGISFMNMAFDHDKGGRDNWIAWLAEILTEARRVIKPGGHMLIWALPRTSHWTATAVEDAGFEIRDVITHLFGSGMPKSLDISKAIDRMAGAEREVVGKTQSVQFTERGYDYKGDAKGSGFASEKYWGFGVDITKPATSEAQQWQGWGSGLKPSSEHWILARAPLAEKSIAAQVLATGTGGLNIDQCRVGTDENLGRFNHARPSIHNVPDSHPNAKNLGRLQQTDSYVDNSTGKGRFPSNTLFSHTIECRQVGVKRVKGTHRQGQPHRNKPYDSTNASSYSLPMYGEWKTYTDEEGLETVEAWECAPYCPIAELDRQSGISKSPAPYKRGAMASNEHIYGKKDKPIGTVDINYGDQGGASRYFKCFQSTEDDYAPFAYFSKPSRRERNLGCEGLPEKAIRAEDGRPYGSHDIFNTPGSGRNTDNKPTANHHPTVKPINLMKYLVTMITPPGGTCLDMFMGSGSTGVACVISGFSFIGIDAEEAYCEIAKARIAYHLAEMEAA